MRQLTPTVRAAKHPVYRTRAVFWGEVFEGWSGKLVYGVGPFRKRAEALHAASMWANQKKLDIGPIDKPLHETVAFPITEQKPCDFGLFGDDSKQGSLF